MTVSVVFAAALFMMIWEAFQPGRKWPRVAGWWLRAIALNACQVGAVYLAGITWDGWMQQHRLWSADRLGVAGGALVGYLVITFVFYWWHRWRHEIDFLWRWFHQVHHSPQRIEVITSFYKHPFELVVNSVLSSAILYLGVGVGAQAAGIAVLITGLAELVYHWNVRTPYWLGFIFQRPESHCIHHQEGVHSFNYSDLPLWDMLFGTFRNPRRFEATCGFGNKELLLREMLVGKDVNKRAEGASA
ncbi:MAG: sterol desaturase family protein [Acidobacteriales bacterium]|nr:sterol desaturase family protein [Terriglobales bacterium]